MQRKFLRPALICIIPCLIALLFIVRAYIYDRFNFGVDLAGGTILIYEIDKERDEQLKKLQAQGGQVTSSKTDITALAEALKRRIDPADLLNVTVRAVGDSRVEIILPFSGSRTGKQNANENKVEEIKRLIEKVGRLEFEIVANSIDDKKGFEEALDYFNTKATPEELDSYAQRTAAPTSFPQPR